MGEAAAGEMAERARPGMRGAGAGALATPGPESGKEPVGPRVLVAVPSHRRLVGARVSCLRGRLAISGGGVHLPRSSLRKSWSGK